MFIIGRAIAGLGASGIFNGGLTIFVTVAPLEKRPSKLAPQKCMPFINIKSITNSYSSHEHNYVDFSYWPGHWAIDRRLVDGKSILALV